MRIIFLGAPGAGKGTQAEIVSARLGIPTVSTGAIIREAIRTQTPMGVKASKYTSVGKLAPDEIVIGIIRERLAQPDCARGYIFDGFPRTVPQAQALDQMGIEVDAVVSIEVSDEEITRRMSGRRVCQVCGATYHVKHNPSRDGKSCDKCGAELGIRKDDAAEVVQSRLKIYHETTEPLKEFYAAKGNLRTVQGQGKVEDTTALVLAALGIS